MNFAAQMRIGSLEVLLALAIFGIVIARSRSRAPAAAPLGMEIELAFGANAVAITLAQGHPPRVLGRSQDADVVLNDPEASRRHAALQVAGGIPYLSDLGSRNGTFLNGKALTQAGIEIKTGDHIDVGNTRITVIAARPLP